MRQGDLFHISEEPAIDWFQPRATPGSELPVVWAIDAERSRNYLVPRDCPRVTFYAGPQTSKADIEQFLGPKTAVMAIDQTWLERARACRLYCYQLPSDTFECIDDCAGYFVSRVAVAPLAMEVLDNPIDELLRRGVDLRVVSSLWPLRDAVVTSTLQFSIIRMRNALPRPR